MITQQRVREYFEELLDSPSQFKHSAPLNHLAMQWADAVNTYIDDGVAQDVVAVAVMHENMNRELGFNLPDASETYDALVEIAVAVA